MKRCELKTWPCSTHAAWEWVEKLEGGRTILFCNDCHEERMAKNSSIRYDSRWRMTPLNGSPLQTTCNCPMDLLMRAGCKCGGL